MSAGPVIAAVLWYLGLLALLAVPIALARHFRNHRAVGEVISTVVEELLELHRRSP